jgi:hypothetical protein
MPYNEEIEARINKLVAGWKHTDKKKINDESFEPCTG